MILNLKPILFFQFHPKIKLNPHIFYSALFSNSYKSLTIFTDDFKSFNIKLIFIYLKIKLLF